MKKTMSKVFLLGFLISGLLVSCVQPTTNNNNSSTPSNSEETNNEKTTSNDFEGKKFSKSFNFGGEKVSIKVHFKDEDSGKIEFNYTDSDDFQDKTATWDFTYEATGKSAVGFTEFATNTEDCWFTLSANKLKCSFALYDKRGNYYTWYNSDDYGFLE